MRRFVRHRFFFDVIYHLRRVDAPLVCRRDVLFRKLGKKVYLFEQPRVFIQLIRHSAKSDIAVLREACLAV